MQREFQDPWIRRKIGNTGSHIAYGREYGNPMPLKRPEPNSFQRRETNRTAMQYHQEIHGVYEEHKDTKIIALSCAKNHLEDILTTAVESGYVEIYEGLEGKLPPEAKPIIMQVLNDTMALSASAASEYDNFLRNVHIGNAHIHINEIIEATTSKIDQSIDQMWSCINT